MNWNFEIEQAPSGYWNETTTTNKAGKEVTTKQFIREPCLVATKCGLVTISSKLKNGRWNFLATKELPVAWAKLLEHPNPTPSNQIVNRRKR